MRASIAGPAVTCNLHGLCLLLVVVVAPKGFFCRSFDFPLSTTPQPGDSGPEESLNEMSAAKL